jgi:peptidoglycan/LPS O-acetylase OafA/YrhL
LPERRPATFDERITQPSADPRRRIPQLDGMRAVAFFSVFCWHAAQVPQKVVLWAGVDLFFVLSGFLITGILMSADKGSLKEYFGHFYGRRARRILPPYAMAVLFAAVLLPVGLKSAWPWYVFFASNLGQALGANIPAPMTTFWSLAVEEQFYLLWPIVVIVCPARLLPRIAVAGILIVPLLRVLCSPWLSLSEGIYLLTPFRLDLLLAGALLSTVWRRHGAIPESWGRFSLPVMAASFAIYVALCFIPSFEKSNRSFLFDGLGYSLIAAFCAAFLMHVLALAPGSLGYRLLTFGPVAYLGRISYMMYLLHSTCIMVSVKYLNGYSHILSRLVALLSTVFLASLSWHFVEKRLLKSPARTPVVVPEKWLAASSGQ